VDGRREGEGRMGAGEKLFIGGNSPSVQSGCSAVSARCRGRLRYPCELN
jgi:hypothetical protein